MFHNNNAYILDLKIEQNISKMFNHFVVKKCAKVQFITHYCQLTLQ